jgi:hypothetical protein
VKPNGSLWVRNSGFSIVMDFCWNIIRVCCWDFGWVPWRLEPIGSSLWFLVAIGCGVLGDVVERFPFLVASDS